MNMLGLLVVKVVVMSVCMLMRAWSKLYRVWHDQIAGWGSAGLLAIHHRAGMVPLMLLLLVLCVVELELSKSMEMTFHYWHGVHHVC